MDKLYYLTGATGLLGSNILRLLCDDQQRVRALVLPGDPARASLPPQVEVTEGDLLDEAALDTFLGQGQAERRVVIHAASIVTLDPRPNEKVRAVNVEGTRKILEACLRHGVDKLVYVSSTGVLPELPQGEVMGEIDHHDPDQVIGYYAKTKAMATKLVFEAAHDQGLDASVVYPSGIFGPYDYGFGMITSCIKMIASGQLRLSIGGSFNSIDARDLACGIIRCAEKGEKGQGYILAGDCYSFRQLADTICQEAGIPRPWINLPLALLRPFAPLGSLYGKMAGRPAWFSSYTLYNLQRNNNYSRAKAERDLGFQSRKLKETIADTIAWLRETGQMT